MTPPSSPAKPSPSPHQPSGATWAPQRPPHHHQRRCGPAWDRRAVGRCVLRAVCRYGWVAGSGSADDHPDQRRIAVHRSVLAVHTRWQTRLGGVDGVGAGASGDQAKAIDQSIKALQDAGGDVMISMGGAAGTSLAQYYSAHGMSAQQLADAYAGMIDTYGVTPHRLRHRGCRSGRPLLQCAQQPGPKLLQQTKPEVQSGTPCRCCRPG